MILAVESDSPDEIRDKGIVLERLQKYQEALDHLNKYLEIAPEAQDVDFILELIRNTREKLNR